MAPLSSIWLPRWPSGGYRGNLVLCKATGPFLVQVPEAVTVVELRRSPLFPASLLAAISRSFIPLLRLSLLRQPPPFPNIFYLPTLVRYFHRARPETLLSARTMSNLLALWRQAGQSADARCHLRAHPFVNGDAAPQMGSAGSHDSADVPAGGHTGGGLQWSSRRLGVLHSYSPPGGVTLSPMFSTLYCKQAKASLAMLGSTRTRRRRPSTRTA